jgi:hypothetical protein
VNETLLSIRSGFRFLDPGGNGVALLWEKSNEPMDQSGLPTSNIALSQPSLPPFREHHHPLQRGSTVVCCCKPGVCPQFSLRETEAKDAASTFQTPALDASPFRTSPRNIQTLPVEAASLPLHPRLCKPNNSFLTWGMHASRVQRMQSTTTSCPGTARLRTRSYVVGTSLQPRAPDSKNYAST